MTSDWSNMVMAVTSLAIALSSIWSWRSKKNDEVGARMRQLDTATRLTRAHGINLNNFMYFETASERLKTFLIEASDALEDRSVILCLVRAAQSGREIDESQDNEIVLGLRQLQRDDPEAADVFIECLSAGIMAAFLRWPEGASALATFAAEFEGSAKREISVAARARRMKINRVEDYQPDYQPLPA